METSFFSKEELRKIPFKSVGSNVMISRKCSIYNPEQISIGNHVRIDDFCILSGIIAIGSYIHISAYAALYGKYGIELQDFSTVSARVLIFSQNDDYSGNFMTNPMVPEEFTNVTGGPVILKKFSIIGAGSVVLPGITLHEGAAVGAMSMVNRDIDEWSVYAGVPASYRKKRERGIVLLAPKIQV